MSRFEVDSDRVAAASQVVQASVQTLGGEAEALMRHLLDLEAVWKGSAATGFQALSASWRSTMERVRVNLEDIQRVLATAGQQYAEVEAANARMFAG
ncbi:WXG100 family type VII secretion target [Kineococcus sp. SYSU DK004]|uniref:WXG100 family type VII secretion target n=1 Tax=Kineococcus sp. SYSU DK004 TaxID=3383125 RepID=UPI003D7EA4BE